MSSNAWKANERSDLPKFYLDLKSYKKAADKNSNPFTPAVNLYFALEEALKIMKAEGLNAIFNRHRKHMKATQAGIKAIGLNLFAEEKHGSPSITSIDTQHIDAELIRKTVKSKFDILLAGGQDHLKGKIFRIGHLGFINDRDIISVIASIESSLDHLKLLKNPLGKGVEAAAKILNDKS